MATSTLGITTGSTSNVASFATGSFTPVASDLLIAMAWATGTVNTTTTCVASANGITFTRLTGFPAIHTLAGNESDFWVANQLVGASPVAMTVTWGTGAAGTGAFVSVVRVSGMSRVGTAAIKQIALNANIAANGAYTATFGTNTTASNALLGFVGHAGGAVATAPGISTPAGWTELSEPADQATPASGFEVAKLDSVVTPATAYSWTSSVATTRANVQAIELDISAAAAPTPPELVMSVPRWS